MGVFTVSGKLLGTARKIVPVLASGYRGTIVNSVGGFLAPENKNHCVLSRNRATEGAGRAMTSLSQRVTTLLFLLSETDTYEDIH